MILQLYLAIIIIGVAHGRVCVCVCVAEHEDRLDDPLSPGDCVEPASRGEAAITTSWALSGRWPTLYSTRPATLTDRQTDGRTESMTDSETGGRGKTKDTACEYFNSGMDHEEHAVSLQTAENRKKP